MTSLVELTGIGLTVERPVRVRILHPLNLTLEAGQSVAIVGPSGAGKTSLASIIGTLQPPSEGSYLFDGQEVVGLSRRQLAGFRSRELGFVFQSAHLMDERSAWRNVALGLDDLESSPTRVEDRSRAALAEVGLSEIADRDAALMSGGERQRTAIARALVKQPRLVIADEPTGALDQRTGQAILDLLYGLVSSQTTLIVVTHDQRAADMADRVVRIIDGKLQCPPG